MSKMFMFSLLLVLLISTIACGEEYNDSHKSQTQISKPTTIPEQAPAEEIEPKVIKEWSGTGIKTTEPFKIMEKPWIIEWQNNPQIIDGQSMGIFQVMVYNTNEPDFPTELAANTMEKASDTSYIYETGEFYLTINSANTDWKVKVLAKE